MKSKLNFYWARLLPKNLVIKCATLGGVAGKSSMPGTIGSALGFILYALVFFNLQLFPYLFFLCVVSYFAMAICDAAESHMMQKDPSSIILDEFIAVPFIFIGLNGNQGLAADLNGWPVYLMGFVLFRVFDILKPFGITKLERVNGGLGCVLDDIVAALVSCVLLHILLLSI